MHSHREHRIHELRSLIERGDYIVSPERVADAVVRCVEACELARADAQAPSEVQHVRSPVRGGLRPARRRWRRSKAPLMAAAG